MSSGSGQSDMTLSVQYFNGVAALKYFGLPRTPQIAAIDSGDLADSFDIIMSLIASTIYWTLVDLPHS